MATALTMSFIVTGLLNCCFTDDKYHNFHFLFDNIIATTEEASTEAPVSEAVIQNEITTSAAQTESPIENIAVTQSEQEFTIPTEVTTAGEAAVTKAPSTYAAPQTVEATEAELMLNLNTATIEELMQLNGIGEVKAEAIIEYRRKHLCFIDIRELNDVDGIGEKLYEQIKDSVFIGTTIITLNWDEPAEITTTEYIEKLNINTATLDQLMTLKGIGEVKAKAIIAYREAEGDFVMIEELKDVTGIGEGIFNKIKDYVTVK